MQETTISLRDSEGFFVCGLSCQKLQPRHRYLVPLQNLREMLGKGLTGPALTSHFELHERGERPIFIHRNLNRLETRTEVVLWICEDGRPFSIVKDRGLLRLLKCGRPGYYVPSPSTVA